ncbi:MAG: polysaccharide export protein [Rhodocyclaceae bacterium]|nr:polysaccharide export protein [Rhodocyclaceae bacterium]
MLMSSSCSVRRSLGVAVGVSLFLLSGCVSLGSSGPNADKVLESKSVVTDSGIRVVDVTGAVAQRVFSSQKRQRFSETLGALPVAGFVVGPGDVLEVSIWEAPPASLFGTVVLDPRGGAGSTHMTVLPEQMVSSEGLINIPFVGAVRADALSPKKLEEEIVRRLQGKANQPQVLVRVIRNATSNVTVVGEVGTSMRMPLTAKGERLLDALAAAGGVRQAIGKTTIQITRGESVQSMALDSVIQDPKQNISLQAGDVVTALHKPLSLTILGATSKNEELEFEAQGITLAQALGRVGGLNDFRANAEGVFIFRLEEPQVIGAAGENLPLTPDGKVPVVYRVNLKDPGTFFVAQGFPMRNKDVMYVANAPAAELQKFLNILVSVTNPILNVQRGFQ